MQESLLSLLWLTVAFGATDPAAAPLTAPDDANWPSFRGSGASGGATGTAPTTWNLETGENIRWTTPIPGLAHSSPVIWGDRLFVTSAVKDGESPLVVGLYGSIDPVLDDSPHKFNVYCLDKNTGDIIWERTAIEAVPKVKRHPKGSHAASSPATDGTHVVAFFASEGLYCYDIDGNLKWTKDLGTLDSGYFMSKEAQWGFASSPVIHDGSVIAQCDVQENSFLASFDVATGEEKWRTPRAEVPTWSTPAIVEHEGKTLIICNGWKHIGGYDFETGAEIWRLEGGGDIPVPTPIVAHGLVYITNAHGRMAPIYAIRLGATGALTAAEGDPHMAWFYERRGNYMQTPIVVGDFAFFCSDAGIASCYDAKTGERKFSERLGGGGTGFTASPVATAEHVYYTSEQGDVYVIKAAPTFEVVAENRTGDLSMATPAMSEGCIYWRTRGQIVCVGPPVTSTGR